jgi:pimeloyl-ACP methyl ester carboxylesterase
MATFVLVPGICHGRWWYEPLIERLTEKGHAASAVSLSGLHQDDRLDRMRPITLDIHIAEASSSLVMAQDPGGVVLVGHDYGGSVITGAADRMPHAVRALVYVDAFVPDDGDSCYSMTDDEQREWFLGGAGGGGVAVEPLPSFDPRARPHPLPTLLQRISLTGNWQRVPVKHYVAATDWPGRSPFTPTVERVRTEPGWTVHEWPTRHDVLAEGPERLLELLIQFADEPDPEEE